MTDYELRYKNYLEPVFAIFLMCLIVFLESKIVGFSKEEISKKKDFFFP